MECMCSEKTGSAERHAAVWLNQICFSVWTAHGSLRGALKNADAWLLLWRF